MTDVLLSVLGTAWFAGYVTADPKCWLQGALRNERGAYCAIGAIERITNSHVPMTALFEGSLSLFDLDPVTVNDVRGHAATLLCFDEAIRLAGGTP